MTIAEGLSRLRGLLNEDATGFWTDPVLYQFLDQAQMLIADFFIAKTYENRMDTEGMGQGFYRHPILEGLSAIDASNTTVSGTREYTLPSDFYLTDYCLYTQDDRENGVAPAKLRSFGEIFLIESNPFLAPTSLFPSYYIRGKTKIGFSPVPTHSGASQYVHYYYIRPLLASSGNSSSEFSMAVSVHDVTVKLAHSLALKRDKQYEASGREFEEAFTIIKSLI